MPRNGSGTYSLPQAAFVAGTVISSSAMNSDLSDIASALTGSLPRDGQAGMTGQLKLADGSSLAPALAFTNDLLTGFSRSTSMGVSIINVDIAGTTIGAFTASGWTGSVQSGIPVGTVTDYAGSSAPSMWILCFGQAVSRTTYASLFAAIGTTYGAGDGVTTFNLPDLRGRALAGKDDMGGSAASRLTASWFGTSASVLGATGGNEKHALSATNQLPQFTPSGTIDTSGLNAQFSQPNGFNVFAGGTGLAQLTGSTAITGTAIFHGSAVGSATPSSFATVQPTLIMNKIIFAGV